MTVIRARVSGFCMGVRRAVNLALEAASPGMEVYTLGPLIHNSRVLGDLEARGIRAIEEAEISLIPWGSTVIIRAHGIAPGLEKKLTGQGLKVLDATCPNVKKNQETARYYAERKYRIFLAGEKNHAEIAGIKGYIETGLDGPDGSCFVISGPDEARAAAEELFRCEAAAKTVLLGQTTISPGEYNAVGKSIRRCFPDLEIVRTICNSTARRQDALRELCGITEAVIIVGDNESANTRRLLSLARELSKPCWLVESPREIPLEARGFAIMGLAAGASTPDHLINEIEFALTG